MEQDSRSQDSVTVDFPSSRTEKKKVGWALFLASAIIAVVVSIAVAFYLMPGITVDIIALNCTSFCLIAYNKEQNLLEP